MLPPPPGNARSTGDRLLSCVVRFFLNVPSYDLPPRSGSCMINGVVFAFHCAPQSRVSPPPLMPTFPPLQTHTHTRPRRATVCAAICATVLGATVILTALGRSGLAGAAFLPGDAIQSRASGTLRPALPRRLPTTGVAPRQPQGRRQGRVPRDRLVCRGGLVADTAATVQPLQRAVAAGVALLCGGAPPHLFSRREESASTAVCKSEQPPTNWSPTNLPPPCRRQVCSGLIPAGHWLLVVATEGERLLFTPRILGFLGLLAVGLGFYLSRWPVRRQPAPLAMVLAMVLAMALAALLPRATAPCPITLLHNCALSNGSVAAAQESSWPGRFDYVGSSHQLWHVCVSAAALYWWHTLLMYKAYVEVQPCK